MAATRVATIEDRLTPEAARNSQSNGISEEESGVQVSHEETSRRARADLLRSDGDVAKVGVLKVFKVV
jgi:hypothetical protein